jgi:hypothetical protein
MQQVKQGMSNLSSTGSGVIATVTELKPQLQQQRSKGQIQAITSAIKEEEGFFYLSDYVQKFPPATTQGVFSILKAYGDIISVSGTIEDAHGNRRVERGKYIRREVAENIELKRAKEEIEQLRAEIESLTK